LVAKLKLTSAIFISKGDDCAGNRGAAGFVAAVPETIAEVNVFAQASSVGRRTSKRWSQGEHVVDTGLTA
jgi:hypothetical protein